MGYGFKLRCKACDYSKNFFLGVGMMYFPLENVITEENIKSKKLRNEILDILDNHDVKESNYGHELYRCEECDKLYKKFYVELHFDEDKVFRTEYSCIKCRKLLTKLEGFETEEITCPECHKKELYEDDAVLWD